MADDNDLDALAFLGDLALQDVLDSVGIGADGLDQLALSGPPGASRAPAAAANNLGRDDIFKDAYEEASDESDGGGLAADDDDEREARERREAERKREHERYYAAGLKAVSTGRSVPGGLSLPVLGTGARRVVDDDYGDEASAGSPASTTAPSPPRAGAALALPSAPQQPQQPVLPSLPAPKARRSHRPAPSHPAAPLERSLATVFPGFTTDGVLDFVGLFGGGAAGGGLTGTGARRERRAKGMRGRRKVKVGKVPLPPPPAPPSPHSSPDQPPRLLPALLPAGARPRADGEWEDVSMLSDDEAEAARAWVDGASGDGAEGRAFRMVSLGEWEDDVVLDGAAPPPPKRRRPNTLAPYNAKVDSGEWVRAIVWDARAVLAGGAASGGGGGAGAGGLEVVEEEGGEEEMPLQPSGPPKRSRPSAAAAAAAAASGAGGLDGYVDPYNISNDHQYEGMKHRVRQTFGSIVVQHAYPALKLQLPFYKTSLTKSELRAWHRPSLQPPTNIKQTFTVSPPARKLKDKVGRKLGKGGDVQEGLRKVGDLTLRDKSEFVLWEFSEENPPIMSGFGMGSVLVNYYRKKTDDDDHIPKLDLGEPFVLDPADEPPYSSFAPVDKGQTQQTLYNNLIKAPLFQHKPAETDFLCVKATVNGASHYYLRDIKNLFVVGQTIPSVQIPGPHARKVSSTAKDRTHQIAYRLLQKAKGNHMKLSRLMKYFPDCHELQMRQRLKDFLEFHRKGIHQQTWRLKAGLKFPDPAEYLKMVDPESVMMIESMAVGRQHLQDSGYGTSEKDEKAEDESKMDSEQKLAPWIMTKTYLHSQRDKAWVQLYGEGDPTGRGEGFSFIKVSMKDVFLREHETAEDRKAYIATLPKSQQKQGHTVQEQIFRLEARRIWDAQSRALSNPVPPELTEEDEQQGHPDARGRVNSSAGRIEDSGGAFTPSSPGYSAFSSAHTPRPPRSPGAMSRASSVDRDDGMSVGSGKHFAAKGEGSRVLKIKRLVDGKWKTEIVRDSNIINAYVRKRQIIEEKTMAADAVAPTGDADRDKRLQKYLQEEIDKLKKNQTRRLNRKKALQDDNKPVTSRKCANCGAVGHMKTNQKCPRWAEFNLKKTAPKANGPLGIGSVASGAVDHLPSGFFEEPTSAALSPAPAAPGPPKLKLSLGKKA